MKNEFFLIFFRFFLPFSLLFEFSFKRKEKENKREMEEKVDSLKVVYRADRDWGTKTEKDGRGEWARLKRT